MAKRTTSRRKTPAKQGNDSTRTILIVAAIVLGLGALGYLLYLSLQGPQALEGIREFVGLSRAHDENVDYAGLELPPTGGAHSGTWQNCGIYDEPVDTKNAVHSLEHGAVWVAYQPDLTADGVTALQGLVRGHPYVLLSPYPGLKSPVVLTAWGIQLEVDSVDDDRVAEFIDRYEQGPQTPELGATCRDGIGTPIG